MKSPSSSGPTAANVLTATDGGTAGLRALTHNRVDERAALPRGSTSNYFRTREALILGIVERDGVRLYKPASAR